MWHRRRGDWTTRKVFSHSKKIQGTRFTVCPVRVNVIVKGFLTEGFIGVINLYVTTTGLFPFRGRLQVETTSCERVTEVTTIVIKSIFFTLKKVTIEVYTTTGIILTSVDYTVVLQIDTYRKNVSSTDLHRPISTTKTVLTFRSTSTKTTILTPTDTTTLRRLLLGHNHDSVRDFDGRVSCEWKYFARRG